MWHAVPDTERGYWKIQYDGQVMFTVRGTNAQIRKVINVMNGVSLYPKR